MKRASEMKQKTFFINSQRLSVAKNCVRPKTVLLTILAINGEKYKEKRKCILFSFQYKTCYILVPHCHSNCNALTD